MKRLLALTSLLLLDSCWVNSIQPFYSDAATESIVLEGLEGLWLGQERDDPDDQICFDFQRRPDGPGYRLVLSERDALPLVLEAHVLEVDGRLFLDTYLEDFDGPRAEGELPAFFLAHVMPIHLAWSLERAGDGFILGLLPSSDARRSLQSVSAERVPRQDPLAEELFNPLVLTGSPASGRRRRLTAPIPPP